MVFNLLKFLCYNVSLVVFKFSNVQYLYRSDSKIKKETSNLCIARIAIHSDF